ncbi:MAG: hypothetical protein ABIH00_00410 [Armatimonadota bacterium]
MKFKVSEITIIAVFAALWGAMEVSLGTFLHVVKMPMVGAFMAAVGSFILLIARSFVPKRGTTMIIGFIAALIKLLSVAGSKLVPAVSIFSESILVEIILSVLGTSVLGYCIAAASAVTLTVFQNIIGLIVISGKGVDYFISMIEYNFARFGIVFKSTFTAILIFISIKVIICIILGITIGIIAWRTTKKLIRINTAKNCSCS